MDRTVKLSDGVSGVGLLTINPELKGILAVAFSPDGRYVLTAGESPELRWWEIADIGESVTERGWTPMRKMQGHVGAVYDMRFSPDGLMLATASAVTYRAALGRQVGPGDPRASRPGQKVKLRFDGFNVDSIQDREVQIPADAKGSFEFQVASNRVELGITDLPAEIEINSSDPKAITVPAAINGRILRDDEVDRYRFSAMAGERFEFEVQARRWGSSLDALIEIRDVSGRLLGAQDDVVNTIGQTVDGLAFPVNKDPRIEWIAPDDGEYEVQVRDANYFGGPQRFYFFAARRQQEDFALILDDDRMPVGPGESVTALVTVERLNGFRGPIRLFVRGLPEGVFAHESVIPTHLNQANIVITARPEAKPDARPILVCGRATIGSSEERSLETERIATPFAPMGQAGGRSFLQVPTAMASVSEASDIILEAEPKVISIDRGKSVTVKIRAVRNKYTGPVEMNVILWNLMQRFSKLPTGLIYEEKLSKTSLGPDETEGYVTFRAEPDAALLDDYLMAVMGQITYNRIYMTRVAASFRLTIR